MDWINVAYRKCGIFFKELKNQGKTILMASHNKEDIDVLCDRVYEMDAGVLTMVR